MEEFHQITIQEYFDWKEDLRRRLAEAASNFVGIGYRLKQIRDSEAYKQDGYTSVFDFASKEYGISASQASRFMAINDKFSKNGNSLEMPEEFTKLGPSKLSEMLTLPESDYQYIDESTTREQIRELKEFNKQEGAFINPPEPAEPDDTQRQPGNDPLIPVLMEYFRDKEHIFNRSLKAAGMDTDAFAKAMNPTGSALAKKGVYMLFLKKPGEICMMKILGKEPVNYSWNDIKAAFTDEFHGKTWAELFAPAQKEEKTEEKAKEQAEEHGEIPKTEKIEKSKNPDKQSETEGVEKEEIEENQASEAPEEPEKPDKQTESKAIKVTKSTALAMNDTKESARELKEALDGIAYLEDFTPPARLEDVMARIQELTVALYCNLKDWKAAAEREDK